MVLFPSLDLSLAHTAKEPKVVWCYISWMVWLNCCERDGNQFLGFAWCFNPASPRTWVMYLNKQFKVTKIRIYKINKKWFKFEKKKLFLRRQLFLSFISSLFLSWQKKYFLLLKERFLDENLSKTNFQWKIIKMIVYYFFYFFKAHRSFWAWLGHSF